MVVLLFVQEMFNMKKNDQRIIDKLNNHMSSARIVGRGTVVVDSNQVLQSPKFQAARIRAKKIV